MLGHRSKNMHNLCDLIQNETSHHLHHSPTASSRQPLLLLP